MGANVKFRDAGLGVDERYAMIIKDHRDTYIYTWNSATQTVSFAGSNLNGVEDCAYWGHLISGSELPDHVKSEMFFAYKRNRELVEKYQSKADPADPEQSREFISVLTKALAS